MEVTKGVGSTTWTWTNSVSWFASKVGGSTLTMTSLTTSPWSLQEDLWASRINAISSFSALRAAISSSSFLFLLSQPSTSTWRVSIWSNLLFLHLAAANLFLSLLILWIQKWVFLPLPLVVAWVDHLDVVDVHDPGADHAGDTLQLRQDDVTVVLLCRGHDRRTSAAPQSVRFISNVPLGSVDCHT